MIAPLVGGVLYSAKGFSIHIFGRTLHTDLFPALLPALGNAVFVFGSLLALIWLVCKVSSNVHSQPFQHALVLNERQPDQQGRREESSPITIRQLLHSPGVSTALAIWAWYCTLAEGLYACRPISLALQSLLINTAHAQ